VYFMLTACERPQGKERGVSLKLMHVMGGDLGGTGGKVPQNLRWGTAHASVPTIFREVVLLEACESTNGKKRKFLSVK